MLCCDSIWSSAPLTDSRTDCLSSDAPQCVPIFSSLQFSFFPNPGSISPPHVPQVVERFSASEAMSAAVFTILASNLRLTNGWFPQGLRLSVTIISKRFSFRPLVALHAALRVVMQSVSQVGGYRKRCVHHHVQQLKDWLLDGHGHTIPVAHKLRRHGSIVYTANIRV